MKNRILMVGALLGALAIPFTAQAQGVPGGVAHGATVGNEAAGPVGAVVGGVVGGVIGGVEGVLGIDQRGYAPDYPDREYRPQYRYHRTVRVRHSHRNIHHSLPARRHGQQQRLRLLLDRKLRNLDGL